jgi:hypothetical protein
MGTHRPAIVGGWAAGVHSALFLSRFAGVHYDAPTATLRFSPLPVLGEK